MTSTHERPDTLVVRQRAAGEPLANRALVFVNNAADAGPPHPSTDVVVLDMLWTPAPDERPDLIPVRTCVRDVLEAVNLFDDSLERLDAWAAATGMPERFAIDGVTWWFHVRGFMRLKVHELMLWCHVLARLAPAGRYDAIVVPSDRVALVEAARAAQATDAPAVAAVRLPIRRRQATGPIPAGVSAPVADTRARIGLASRLRRRGRRILKAVLRRVGLVPPKSKPPTRVQILQARIDAIAAEPLTTLAVVRAPSFHAMREGDTERHADPYVQPVLDALAARGEGVVSVAIDLNHRNDAHWELIMANERLLPMSFVNRRWAPSEEEILELPDLVARLADIPDVPLDVMGFDIAPAVRAIVSDLHRWFDKQRHGLIRAERLMRAIQPRVVFTGWESARTSWLGAAHRLGIPSVAVQHGIIYPNSPDYYRPDHPTLVRPTLTCVFGPYERDLLIEHGGFDSGAVVVTGSPRIDRDLAMRPGSDDERERVRQELGVEGDDRLLVISAGHNPVGEDIHNVSMVARLLDGWLPGIHLVFKLHPEDESGAQYPLLLNGLAVAGGYPAPRITIIRDVDIYRLLRSADAHLGQYSTVLTDSVLTGTPNMVAVGQAWSDIIGYVAAGVAVPVRTVEDIRAFMRNPAPPTAADRERFLASHYRDGDAAARIAEAILHRSGSPATAAP